MSQALTRASPLKADIRLAQAVSEFEANLSSEQKSAFRTLKSQSLSTTPSPNDVMVLTAEMDRRISRKFRGQCFGPRFTNFLQGVQQFAALGDIVVGGSQNLIACGVWSLVRMSILSIVSLSSYVDKLSSIFMDIGRSAPRYQETALIYPRSKRLQSCLSEYFIVVINLCRHLFNFAQMPVIQQFTSSLNDANLKAFRDDLEKWATSIREEMETNEIKENSGFRALSRSIFKSASHHQKLAAKNRVLKLCSTFDHEVAWKQLRKAGNASFHTSCVEYQDWKECSDPCTLIITGKLGSGKSVLLANIVEDVSLPVAKISTPVAYFFCKHDVSESLKARTILGSLARQLLRTVSDLGVLSETCEDDQTDGDVDKVLSLLLQGFPRDQKAYLVIDGLDECDSDERDFLVQAVKEIQGKLSVLICASFREGSNNGLQPITEQLFATCVVQLPDDNPDIEAFIEADLERCLRKDLLKIGDPTLILDIQDALLKGSQGMILWAALQIQSLCGMRTDHAIREALSDLPKDLSQTFSRILHRSGNSDRLLQAKILQIVLAACRPLTTDELREALSVTPGDTNWDPNKVLNDINSALACCGCLLAIDEEESTVRIVHHSVKQYILHDSDDKQHMGFPIEEAKRTLANIVVTYLEYGVFGTELSTTRVRPIVAHSVAATIAKNTMGTSSASRHLAMKLLKSKKLSAIDLTKTVAEARGSLYSKPEDVFKFYAYAKAHWQDYVLYVSGHDHALLKLSSNLIHKKTPDQPSTAGMIDWADCHWAAENGNKIILSQLIEVGKVDIHTRDSSGQTLLISAAAHGQESLLGLLLQIELLGCYLPDNAGKTALRLMAEERHKKVVGRLFEYGNERTSNRRKSDGWTPIMKAVVLRDEILVDIMLRMGDAKLDAKNDDGQTAFDLALANRLELIARLLTPAINEQPMELHATEVEDDREQRTLSPATSNSVYPGRSTSKINLLLAAHQYESSSEGILGQYLAQQEHSDHQEHLARLRMPAINEPVELHATEVKDEDEQRAFYPGTSNRQEDLQRVIQQARLNARSIGKLDKCFGGHKHNRTPTSRSIPQENTMSRTKKNGERPVERDRPDDTARQQAANDNNAGTSTNTRNNNAGPSTNTREEPDNPQEQRTATAEEPIEIEDDIPPPTISEEVADSGPKAAETPPRRISERANSIPDPVPRATRKLSRNKTATGERNKDKPKTNAKRETTESLNTTDKKTKNEHDRETDDGEDDCALSESDNNEKAGTKKVENADNEADKPPRKKPRKKAPVAKVQDDADFDLRDYKPVVPQHQVYGVDSMAKKIAGLVDHSVDVAETFHHFLGQTNVVKTSDNRTTWYAQGKIRKALIRKRKFFDEDDKEKVVDEEEGEKEEGDDDEEEEEEEQPKPKPKPVKKSKKAAPKTEAKTETKKAAKETKKQTVKVVIKNKKPTAEEKAALEKRQEEARNNRSVTQTRKDEKKAATGGKNVEPEEKDGNESESSHEGDSDEAEEIEGEE